MENNFKIPRLIVKDNDVEKRVVLKLDKTTDIFSPVLFESIKAGDIFLWEGKIDNTFELCFAISDVIDGINSSDIISLDIAGTEIEFKKMAVLEAEEN